MTKRAEFEAWVSRRTVVKKYGAKLITRPDGSYADYRINDRWLAWCAALATPPAENAQPVAEIVLFGGDCKEVSWRNGKMPAPGTKLYANAATADAPARTAIKTSARLTSHRFNPNAQRDAQGDERAEQNLDKNEDDPELGPCRDTCGFYVKGRACACAASRRHAAAASAEASSLRGAANLAFNALHECKPNKGAEKQVSDAIQALTEALHDIAYTVNRTATPQQFADHLQREARAALSRQPSAAASAPTDEEILSLNEGEVYFSVTDSKYDFGPKSQYHTGIPGLLKFARALLAKHGSAALAAAKPEGGSHV